MRSATLLWLLLAAACALPDDPAPAPARGARLVRQSAAVSRFDRTQSAALFVGVQKFHDRTHKSVPYAVDDAVDLAYTFAFERHVALVNPRRVVLAISGQPQKTLSRTRLRRLNRAGARMVPATRPNILAMLEQQARSTGPDGIFIAGFASHGFTVDGTPYVAAATSRFRDQSTSVSASQISDTAASARRSLIFIDACRERVAADVRAPAEDAPAPAVVMQRMPAIDGQVVFYAGTYAYDDHKKQNGVFTSAILDCLRCDMLRDARGVVTAQLLVESVEKRVLKWINENRDPELRAATQVKLDVDARGMPLAVCARIPGPERVEKEGSSVVAFSADGTRLWQQEAQGAIARAEAADLDGDGANEVVAATGRAIEVFGPDGERLWSAPAPELRTFITADLFRKRRRQLLALTPTRLSIFDADGTLLSSYTHPGQLLHLVVDRATSHHSPRIVVTAENHRLDALNVQGNVGSVVVLNPKKVRHGAQLWQGAVLPASPIAALQTLDYDNDGHRDIAVKTAKGMVVLTFDGRIIKADGAQFVLLR